MQDRVVYFSTQTHVPFEAHECVLAGCEVVLEYCLHLSHFLLLLMLQFSCWIHVIDGHYLKMIVRNWALVDANVREFWFMDEQGFIKFLAIVHTQKALFQSIFLVLLFDLKFYSALVHRVFSWVFQAYLSILEINKPYNPTLFTAFELLEYLYFFHLPPLLHKLCDLRVWSLLREALK